VGQDKTVFQVHFHAFHAQDEKSPGKWSARQGWDRASAKVGISTVVLAQLMCFVALSASVNTATSKQSMPS
jgi:hypothetical protein